MHLAVAKSSLSQHVLSYPANLGRSRYSQLPILIILSVFQEIMTMNKNSDMAVKVPHMSICCWVYGEVIHTCTRDAVDGTIPRHSHPLLHLSVHREGFSSKPRGIHPDLGLSPELMAIFRARSGHQRLDQLSMSAQAPIYQARLLTYCCDFRNLDSICNMFGFASPDC